jgi:2-methylisocitrate lyase-like PEP mutase family enzyme
LISTVESIARVIQVPLSVDIEAGYSDDLGRVTEVIDAVLAAGAVGINIEDGSARNCWHARSKSPAKPLASAM